MYTTDDVNALGCIVYWEARGEPEAGQLAVANVVLNRVRDRRWPDTIKQVIEQKAQFTPVWSDAACTVMNPKFYAVEVPQAQLAIAQRALAGEKAIPDDYYYFSVGKATKYAKDFIKIGNHWFGRDIRDGDILQKQRNLFYAFAVTGNLVNIRRSPNGTVIGQANKGDIVAYAGEDTGDWLRIRVNGIIGYMAKKYLTVQYMRGEDVRALQDHLNELGYSCGTADSVFGVKTYDAVCAYQKAKGLTVDGIVGPNTWASLQTSAPAPVSGSTEPEDRLITWGFGDLIAAKGRPNAVKQFQAALGLAVDGDIGPKTTAALEGEVIVPRILESEMRCQCPGYCDGYPAGHVSIGVRILAERIFREVEKTYPGTQFFLTTREHPTPNGGIAGGERCERWNEERGGAGGSMHKQGIAMDIYGKCPGVADKVIRQRIEDVALQMNTKGGVGYEGAYIVHIDTRGTKSRWGY